MIIAHGPTIFGDDVVAGVSSASDGTMKIIAGTGDGIDDINNTTRNGIRTFTGALGIPVDSLTYQSVDYATDNFCRYATVGRATVPFTKVMGDALFTTERGAALFLPLADCTGAVLYDPEHKVLGIAHLGRHSTEQYGGLHVTEYMTRNFQTDPAWLRVWLGPSPNGGIYPLWRRENRSLHEANRADFRNAGVTESNIEVSPVDTAVDPDYFSHSEFLKGRRSVDGRFAIAAMLT